MPRPASSKFPFADHRSMDVVLADEAHGCSCELTDCDDADGHSADCPAMAAYLAELEGVR